jgi:hypothetical protein
MRFFFNWPFSFFAYFAYFQHLGKGSGPVHQVPKTGITKNITVYPQLLYG